MILVRFDDHDGLLPRQRLPGQVRRRPSVALDRLDDVSDGLTATSISLLEHDNIDIGQGHATNRIVGLPTRLCIEACIRVVEDNGLFELGIRSSHVRDIQVGVLPVFDHLGLSLRVLLVVVMHHLSDPQVDLFLQTVTHGSQDHILEVVL